MSIRLTLLLLVIGFSVSAQMVAEDWTQTDCAGVEHQLYETLDTGSVVVMEIVMLEGCMPCINAAHWMEPVIDAFNAAYDGRVLWYTFGYNDSYSCTQLSDWKIENAIGCDAQFMLGADIASYYGGMGMPTIVVAGRSSHTVYFNQFGFVPADTIEFAQAITYALGLEDPEVNVQSAVVHPIDIYPNPVSELLQVQLPESIGVYTYTITDITGRSCLQGQLTPGSHINVHTLTSGLYQITLDNAGMRYQSTFLCSR